MASSNGRRCPVERGIKSAEARTKQATYLPPGIISPFGQELKAHERGFIQ